MRVAGLREMRVAGVAGCGLRGLRVFWPLTSDPLPLTIYGMRVARDAGCGLRVLAMSSYPLPLTIYEMRVAGVARVARCGLWGIAGCCGVSRSSVFGQQPSDIRHWSSILGPRSSVLRPPSLVFRQSHSRFPRLVPDSRFQILRFQIML